MTTLYAPHKSTSPSRQAPWHLKDHLHPRHYVMAAIASIFVLAQLWSWLSPYFMAHEQLRMALLGASSATGLTALGALGVFFTRSMSTRTQNMLLGYGGGVMLAASVFSLILPAIHHAELLGYAKTPAVLLTATGIMLGGIFVLALNHLLPHEHFLTEDASSQLRAQQTRIWLFVMAVTIHNFPEGLAIGVGFGGEEIGKAVALAAGIGIQDIPEGFVVAMALRSIGFSNWKAAGVGILSGFAEPVGAVLGVIASDFSATALPWTLAMAGGAMLFVISHEVIPESHKQGHETPATLGLLLGFITMLLLDILLG
jgi:ZIP family zinc transporter